MSSCPSLFQSLIGIKCNCNGSTSTLVVGGASWFQSLIGIKCNCNSALAVIPAGRNLVSIPNRD